MISDGLVICSFASDVTTAAELHTPERNPPPCRLARQEAKFGSEYRLPRTPIVAAGLSSKSAGWQTRRKGYVACIVQATTSAAGGGRRWTGGRQRVLALQSSSPAAQHGRGRIDDERRSRNSLVHPPARLASIVLESLRCFVLSLPEKNARPGECKQCPRLSFRTL